MWTLSLYPLLIWFIMGGCLCVNLWKRPSKYHSFLLAGYTPPTPQRSVHVPKCYYLWCCIMLLSAPPLLITFCAHICVFDTAEFLPLEGAQQPSSIPIWHCPCPLHNTMGPHPRECQDCLQLQRGSWRGASTIRSIDSHPAHWLPVPPKRKYHKPSSFTGNAPKDFELPE